MTKCGVWLGLALLSLPFAPALAQKPAQDEVRPTAGPTCDLEGYSSVTQLFPTPIAIPDNDHVTRQIGQIATAPDGSVMIDVIVEITLAHTWAGDLIVRVEYGDCAGGPAQAGVNVICRPRGTAALFPVPCGSANTVGCSGNLGNGRPNVPPYEPSSYTFSDDAATALAEGDCPSSIPAGCYRPQTPGGALSAFDGRLKGGCFRLGISDWFVGDRGIVSSWAVHTKTDRSVPATNRTWGQVKTLYR